MPAKAKIDPKDIPPPTPINLPRFQPFANADDPIDPTAALTSLLQSTGRSLGVLGAPGFAAVGLNLNSDVKPEDLIPDPSLIPDFKQWDSLSLDDARDQNQSTRQPMKNGNLAPGCQVYLERKKELMHVNEDAFRTVRRIQPPKGKQQARLGNTYEFFRCLEAFTTFWDDPSAPPPVVPSPEATPADETPGSDASKAQSSDEDPNKVYRTSAGNTMPADYRNNLLTAFVKLVAYDFGCSVAPARQEPRLHLSSTEEAGQQPRKSYYPSGCVFVFQSPMTRESARAGTVYGPVATITTRGTTDFSNPSVETAQSLDLAREIVAALITAQHRAREGKTEKRFGEGQWWTTKKRWGGGPGGPIGREADKDAIQGDKDASPADRDGVAAPPSKKARKTMTIYDNYRTVRAPAQTWDKKAQYEAIGRVQGANYDDIFVVSSLFHHVSILRVRVPNRLLEVLDGEPEPDPTRRSWGKVEAWRSPWYDLFMADQRVEALKLVWIMMAYQMRRDVGSVDEDVKMANA